MSLQEWPAEDYAVGTYIQTNIAKNYLKYLSIKPTDYVLDIGCGNGAFSRNIIDKIPQGLFLGIDSSENMLKLAKEELMNYPNARVQQDDVLTMKFYEQFNYIVSFWCLHWCALAIETAFLNMYHALKPEGKILAFFPSGADSFITSFEKIKASAAFPSLEQFKPPVNYLDYHHLQEKMRALPFKGMQVKQFEHRLLLPSLDIFRKFVNGIAFFHGQLASDKINEINEAVVNVFEQECQEKYRDKYEFSIAMYLINAER